LPALLDAPEEPRQPSKRQSSYRTRSARAIGFTEFPLTRSQAHTLTEGRFPARRRRSPNSRTGTKSDLLRPKRPVAAEFIPAGTSRAARCVPALLLFPGPFQPEFGLAAVEFRLGEVGNRDPAGVEARLVDLLQHLQAQPVTFQSAHLIGLLVAQLALRLQQTERRTKEDVQCTSSGQ
jgi:hypothetical protein